MMVMNGELEGMWKEVAVIYVYVQSKHSLWETKKNSG